MINSNRLAKRWRYALLTGDVNFRVVKALSEKHFENVPTALIVDTFKVFFQLPYILNTSVYSIAY